MSARIIIEKDGERYVANDLTVRLIDGDRWLCVENKISNCYVASTFTKLTPVIRTDNSAVIARLEAENAKLREALKPVLEVKMSAERINSYRIHELHVETFSAVRKAQEIMKGEKK